MRRDFVGLERRRIQAARLLEKGYSEAEVARRVGVHRQSVNRWAKTLAAAGQRGLRRAGRPGRPSKLSREDLVRIAQCLKQGPEQFGYQTGLWTLPRVTKLIEEQCGVRYHLS
jgi:transposase